MLFPSCNRFDRNRRTINTSGDSNSLTGCIGVVGYGGGRLGGGSAAGAGEGAGGAVPLLLVVVGTGTGLALPPSVNGPLLRGSPVVGKSDLRGAAGLGVVVCAWLVGVDAKTTDPPSEPCEEDKIFG